MFIKSQFILALAIRSRAPGASSRALPALKHLAWLHRLVLSISTYFDYAQYKSLDGAGVEIQNLPPQVKNSLFFLVHGGGLCLCSSEFYSPNTFKTSSEIETGKLGNYELRIIRSTNRAITRINRMNIFTTRSWSSSFITSLFGFTPS